MTLAWSRHQYVEFVRDQTVATWLGCKRRARAALDLATMRRQSGSHYLNGGNYFDIRKIALGQS